MQYKFFPIALSNKTATGTPSQYWVQRFIDRVTMTIYLTPSSTQNGHTINYNYIKRKVRSNRRKFGYNWFSRKIGKKSGPWVGNGKAFTQYYNARPIGWRQLSQKRKAICELDFAK